MFYEHVQQAALRIYMQNQESFKMDVQDYGTNSLPSMEYGYNPSLSS